jgi:hypothetical protein
VLGGRLSHLDTPAAWVQDDTYISYIITKGVERPALIFGYTQRSGYKPILTFLVHSPWTGHGFVHNRPQRATHERCTRLLVRRFSKYKGHDDLASRQKRQLVPKHISVVKILTEVIASSGGFAARFSKDIHEDILWMDLYLCLSGIGTSHITLIFSS